MKGFEFIQKIKDVESCIAMLNESISESDGSKLALDNPQQMEIRTYLNHYRKLLLELELLTEK